MPSNSRIKYRWLLTEQGLGAQEAEAPGPQPEHRDRLRGRLEAGSKPSRSAGGGRSLPRRSASAGGRLRSRPEALEDAQSRVLGDRWPLRRSGAGSSGAVSRLGAQARRMRSSRSPSTKTRDGGRRRLACLPRCVAAGRPGGSPLFRGRTVAAGWSAYD